MGFGHFFSIGIFFAAGPTVCETVYESECATSYHEHEVEEDVPQCQIMQVNDLTDIEPHVIN